MDQNKWPERVRQWVSRPPRTRRSGRLSTVVGGGGKGGDGCERTPRPGVWDDREYDLTATLQKGNSRIRKLA